jgi:hypothetical protein
VNQSELESRAARTNSLVVSAVSGRSARDRQKTLGPSELGERCEYCLGEKILIVQKGTSRLTVKKYFSYAAWVGTAIHEKLDRAMENLESEVFTVRELTLMIASLPGLGDIWGHTDCYVPDWGEVIDYKTKLDKEAVYKLLHQEELTRTEGILEPRLEKMWDQTMLYGLGVERSGKPVEAVSLVVLPRYSDDLGEIKTVTRRYDRDRALGVLDRVARTVEKLRIFGVTSLAMGDDCWNCTKLRV